MTRREDDTDPEKPGNAVEVAWIGIAILIALTAVIAMYWGDLGGNTASNGPAVNSRETTGSTGVR